jgi:hypothetical protein
LVKEAICKTFGGSKQLLKVFFALDEGANLSLKRLAPWQNGALASK